MTTVESLVAALVEAGPEVAEHMVKAANELLLAAQAITSAAERRLAEQRRLREEAETDVPSAGPVAEDASPATASGLRPVDEVA